MFYEGSRWLFVVIALAVIGGVLYLRKEIEQSGVLACMGAALFTGGAVGNLLDRTLHGVVIDFFDFRIWPVLMLQLTVEPNKCALALCARD